MNLPTYLTHGLEWMGPALGLTLLALLYTALQGRTETLRWGWLGTGCAWLAVGGCTQGVTALLLRWPDGSMAAYGLLVLMLAISRVALVRKKQHID
ncbi:MAG: hypothetical protein QM527_13305 [Alphaproteobacteria bacterium]|nr:hypothetical protein [Alphaproteobacteria bacterium]